MSIALSQRAQKMPSSPIRKLVGAAEARKKQGIKVYHLNIGQPDIKTPEIFYERVREFNENPVAYAPSQGIAKSIVAWQKYFHDTGIELGEKEIMITAGGSEALIFAMCIVADPGDEVLAFEPFYTNYNSFGSVGGITVKAATLSIDNGFHLPSDEEIEKGMTGKTKAIIFTNPSNPTGTVFNKAELQRVVNLAIKHNLFIIADETYREFSFTGEACFSLMNFPEVKDKVILVDSASKRFNLCGARIGVIGSHNEEVMAAAFKFCMARLSVVTIEQEALIPILENAKQYIDPVVEEYRKRRDVIYEGLKKIPGAVFSKPEGAFYVICGLPVKNSEHFAKWLIEEYKYKGETVLLAPAPGFYATPGKGQNEVRLAYVLNSEDLQKALDIVKRALEAYNAKNN
ncbi:MAG: pyridoxal phosphate-dependent aminotransferase [Patescibacteria group bacterium]|jgi:aspartate aminotransferase